MQFIGKLRSTIKINLSPSAATLPVHPVISCLLDYFTHFLIGLIVPAFAPNWSILNLAASESIKNISHIKPSSNIHVNQNKICKTYISVASQVAQWVKNLLPCRRRRTQGSVPVSGRSTGRGKGNPCQYSCQETPMHRGALWATVRGVAESDMTEVTEYAHVLVTYHYKT